MLIYSSKLLSLLCSSKPIPICSCASSVGLSVQLVLAVSKCWPIASSLYSVDLWANEERRKMRAAKTAHRSVNSCSGANAMVKNSGWAKSGALCTLSKCCLRKNHHDGTAVNAVMVVLSVAKQWTFWWRKCAAWISFCRLLHTVMKNELTCPATLARTNSITSHLNFLSMNPILTSILKPSLFNLKKADFNVIKCATWYE